jgi:hypothetical protein
MFYPLAEKIKAMDKTRLGDAKKVRRGLRELGGEHRKRRASTKFHVQTSGKSFVCRVSLRVRPGTFGFT